MNNTSREKLFYITLCWYICVHIEHEGFDRCPGKICPVYNDKLFISVCHCHFNHDITPAMGTQLDCQFIECEIKQQYNH